VTQSVVSVTMSATQSGVKVSEYISDSLGQTVIPGGIQRFYLHFLKGASASIIQTYATIGLADINGVKYTDPPYSIPQAINYSNVEDITYNSGPVSLSLDIVSITSTIQVTDRVVVTLYVNNLETSTQSVSFYTEG